MSDSSEGFLDTLFELVLDAMGVVDRARLFGARKMDFVNPVRSSVWKDEDFRNRIESPIAAILRNTTPRAGRAHLLHAATFVLRRHTQWAEALQKMVAKQVPVDDGLDQLAASIDKQLKDAARLSFDQTRARGSRLARARRGSPSLARVRDDQGQGSQGRLVL